MSEDSKVMDVLVQRSDKLAKRRQFFRSAGGVGLGLIGGTILGACGGGSSSASAQSGPTDPEILNFALNLEYLEATFYAYATTGAGLPASLMSGAGTAGTVIPGHAVTFSDPVVQAYANEIAKDELEHVTFLRTALGASAVAMPALDVGYQNPNGAFSKAAQAAGLVPAGTAFDPYLNDETFLLAAFIFEDVGVTAYKGAAPLISNSTYLSAAAGILAAEAYHAGLVRTTLYAKGIATPSLGLIAAAGAISNARNALDNVGNDDQGIAGATPSISNIVPLDSNGIAFSRNYGNVLNIVYLTNASVTQGGFFPVGVNGTLHMSA
ncbi:Ferritin-like domain protein (plasmid) [Caballeronia sp. SBC1]|uniref:ferritin-like domain-containing protein n=1 Tax=unclassified Caballeronia TaxID=2646786 RepID=UPI0013E1D4E0|nr:MULTISPECIES: ferritin-like domain-containing protein [unclassified Caballeronia]QIE27667.1 Ferritin-like domain protein [Caballeronia sp. SBC2]QIN65733.1 Ferritin-like domain protein [Caballeronia sp. SBC1]